VTISEHRILELGAQKVKIQYKDYADEREDSLSQKSKDTLKLVIIAIVQEV